MFNTCFNQILGKKQLLRQVGRVIHGLMGDTYRLLYQEEIYRHGET